MTARRRPELRNRATSRRNAIVRSARSRVSRGKRGRHIERERSPFIPPEDWHEPVEHDAGSFRVLVQEPGPGYSHPVTAEDIIARLAELPAEMTAPLQVVQLSRMTHKKSTSPCYGMQWGSAIYLYPIEFGFVEYFSRAPLPGQINEARMYGGRWIQTGETWKLHWTPEAIRDYYLNNILIHELGHLLDDRNRSYADRERFAEWFALEHGYRRPRRRVRRRHHG